MLQEKIQWDGLAKRKNSTHPVGLRVWWKGQYLRLALQCKMTQHGGTSRGDAMGGMAEGAKVGVARVGVAWSCRQYLRFSKSPKDSPCLDRVRATWKNNLEKVGARLVDL